MKKRFIPIAICGTMFCFIAGLDAPGTAGPANPADPRAADQPEAVKAKIEATAKQAQLVFVATVTKVANLGEAKGTPRSILMEVTVKDRTMLKGPGPETLSLPPTFSYAAVQGQAFIPAADQKVLVMGYAALAGPIIGGPPTLPGQGRKVGTRLNVLLLVAATDENVAAAKGALGGAGSQPAK